MNFFVKNRKRCLLNCSHNIAKPDQINHLWKGWILRKSWTCVFHCPAFLGQQFLVKVGNLIRLRNTINMYVTATINMYVTAVAKPDQTIHRPKKRVNSKSWTHISTLSSFLDYPAPASRTVRKVICIICTFRITQLREAGPFEKFFASSTLSEPSNFAELSEPSGFAPLF